MVAEIFKLPLLNFSCPAEVEVLEGALESFPLELKLTSELQLEILSVHDFLSQPRILCLIFFERWVLDAVVAEIKAFTLVNGSSHPFAEIVIAELAFSLTVKVLQYLHQIKIVKQIVMGIAKVPHDVLRTYLSVLVNIKVQESLTHGNPSLLEALSQKLCHFYQLVPNVLLVLVLSKIGARMAG